jgi:ABC-type bacteriocin/lantibiotic exporter with double-glycine peptidase domain
MARAVDRRPAIRLLDEVTSHLDAHTEQRVDANMGRLACTRIVIAHRLSTMRRDPTPNCWSAGVTPSWSRTRAA